jgi:hypothetical protein
MSKFVGTGPSSYKKRIYRAAVSQRLRNTGIDSIVTRVGVNDRNYRFDSQQGQVILISELSRPAPRPAMHPTQ